MEKKEMIIDTNFGIVDYMFMVDEIAEEFFDEDGTYQPHYGKLNAMRLFYNNCVVESKFERPHNISDGLDMEEIISDEEFIEEYNLALKGNGRICFDFSNAYSDAIKIVESKNTPLNSLVVGIRNLFDNINEKVSPVLSEDGVEKLLNISDEIKNGKATPEAIVDAYINKTRENTSTYKED